MLMKFLSPFYRKETARLNGFFLLPKIFLKTVQSTKPVNAEVP